MSGENQRKSSVSRGKWSHRRLYGSTSVDTDSIHVVDEEANKGFLSKIEAKKKQWIILGIAMLLIVVFLIIGFTVSASNAEPEVNSGYPENAPGFNPAIGDNNHTSILGNFSTAAVAADGGAPCAKIGVDVLKRNGTAVDAAIATLFCNGLVSSHSMGIGGGFLMTVFDKKSGKVWSIDAREAAPAAANVTMYNGNQTWSSKGPLAVAVPGEIKGYWKAKQMFGNKNVTWESLVRPAIEMARNGIPVTWSNADAQAGDKNDILRDPGMRAIFINPKTNDTWKEGDRYPRQNLAETLERIATIGPDDFYEGEIAKNFVKDLQDLGGIITMDDMKNYQPIVKSAINVSLSNGDKLYSIPPPGSGIILGYILNILEYYNISPANAGDPLMYHRIVEAFKWAYAYRSKIGDPEDPDITKIVNDIVANLTSDTTAFNTFKKINDSGTHLNPKYYGADFDLPPEAGTSHTSVLAPNGDAVAVTSTINLHFGAGIMSPSTGIIYNDEMDDFSSPNITNEFGLPPSPHNFIKPGKRPQSSMCPAILIDKNNNARVVIGAAGGSKITTAVAFATLQNLWLGKDIKQSIDTYRIHHQLVPMRVDYEKGVSQEILQGLTTRGHKVNELNGAGSVVSGITVENDGRVYANSDRRKAGGINGF